MESTVSLTSLGYTRHHESAEEFARIMAQEIGAVSVTSAVTIAEIIEHLKNKVDRKTIYNKLARPGYVKVLAPDSPARYYYLSSIFMALAEEQGSKYYPKHTGPLAGRKIPKIQVVNSTQSALDIEGTIPSSFNAEPVSVRAMGISDQNIMEGVLTESLGGISKVLRNPVGKREILSNAIVLLAGIYRWLDHYEGLDMETQHYILDNLPQD